MDVVDVALDDLRPHPRNPRKITPARLEQLGRTLEAERDMLRARPVIALPDGTVVAGNQRLAAARALGWKSIPTVYADLDERQQTRWMLLDNRGFGEDVVEDVAALLAELATAGDDLALTGYDPADVDRLLASIAKPTGDPDAVPDPPADPRSVRGEVYELGPHRVMCGDSTAEADVGALVATRGQTGGASMLWTDPPYGVNYVGKTADALTIENDGGTGLRELLAAAFVAGGKALQSGAPFYVAAPAGPRGTDFRLAFLDAGWQFHQALVWVKDVMVLGHSDYHYRHEDILYGWVPGPGRSGRGNHDGSRWRGDHSQTTVLEVPRPKRSTEHPTMKPVELIEAALANSSVPGDAVLDLFAGSGSTMVACESTGRVALCMEIDPQYVDVIRQRYADYTNRPDLAP